MLGFARSEGKTPRHERPYLTLSPADPKQIAEINSLVCFPVEADPFADR